MIFDTLRVKYIMQELLSFVLGQPLLGFIVSFGWALQIGSFLVVQPMM